MKISEFVLKFKNAEKQEDQTGLVIDNIKNEYVPYEVKVAHCEAIAERTMLDENGKVRLNTPARYMLLIVVFIQDHMDLAFAGIDNVAMFNAMEECGADDAICGILDTEFKEYRAILDMCVDDLLDAKRNYVDYIDKIVEKAADNVSDIILGLQQMQEKAEAEKPVPKKRRSMKKKASEDTNG